MSKLFSDFGCDVGCKVFPFKLILEEKLPERFYKSRKYGIKVKLVSNTSRSSSCIFNSKNTHNLDVPLDIFIGVFDCNGNWVKENTANEPILKGITSS